MVETPTRKGLERRRMAKGTLYDFKREVNFDKKHPAAENRPRNASSTMSSPFPNGEAGHLIIGASESDGVWDSLVAINTIAVHSVKQARDRQSV